MHTQAVVEIQAIVIGDNMKLLISKLNPIKLAKRRELQVFGWRGTLKIYYSLKMCLMIALKVTLGVYNKRVNHPLYCW